MKRYYTVRDGIRTAYWSLAFFEKLPGVAEQRQQIKAQETNPQLIELYEQVE